MKGEYFLILILRIWSAGHGGFGVKPIAGYQQLAEKHKQKSIEIGPLSLKPLQTHLEYSG
jgi:hypothetical protein